MGFQGHIEKGMVVFDQPPPLPDGTPVLVEAMAPVPEFWRPASLDELARRQGVSAAGSLEDLLGGWPADELNDEFEEEYLGWRERELDQHP